MINELNYDKLEDNWEHRSSKMTCKTCMHYSNKRCRRHAPTMQGFPAVYETDWCGDHKMDKEEMIEVPRPGKDAKFGEGTIYKGYGTVRDKWEGFEIGGTESYAERSKKSKIGGTESYAERDKIGGTKPKTWLDKIF